MQLTQPFCYVNCHPQVLSVAGLGKTYETGFSRKGEFILRPQGVTQGMKVKVCLGRHKGLEPGSLSLAPSLGLRELSFPSRSVVCSLGRPSLPLLSTATA